MAAPNQIFDLAQRFKLDAALTKQILKARLCGRLGACREWGVLSSMKMLSGVGITSFCLRRIPRLIAWLPKHVQMPLDVLLGKFTLQFPERLRSPHIQDLDRAERGELAQRYANSTSAPGLSVLYPSRERCAPAASSDASHTCGVRCRSQRSRARKVC